MVVINKIVILFSLIGILIILPSTIYSQNNNTAEIPFLLSIPPVSLLNFAVGGEQQLVTYSYSFLEPNNVEQIITPSTGDKTWINYSSIVNSGATNYITVNISSGNLPAGVTLRVLISEDSGLGSGLAGTAVREITLSRYPQNIIVNIGSCFTGVGINKGHRLTYIWDNLENSNYENRDPIGVTYTITSTE